MHVAKTPLAPQTSGGVTQVPPKHSVDGIEGQTCTKPLCCTGMGGEAVQPLQKGLCVNGAFLLLLREEERKSHSKGFCVARLLHYND